MQFKKKNRREDLKILVSLGSDYEVGTRFRLVFNVGNFGNTFVCELNNAGEYVHCEKVDDTHVLCLLNEHNLPCGILGVEIYLWLVDAQMPDGYLRLTSRKLVEIDIDGTMYHIELTNGISDLIGMTETTFDLLGNVLKGQALTYDDLTAAQKADLKKPATDAAEALQEAADRGDFDGYSPTAIVTEKDYGAEIKVTDKYGTTTAKVYNGKGGGGGGGTGGYNPDYVTISLNASSQLQVKDGSITESKLAASAKMALLDSAALTGVPTAPTAASGTETTQIATTAFVMAAVKAMATATGDTTNYPDYTI